MSQTLKHEEYFQLLLGAQRSLHAQISTTETSHVKHTLVVSSLREMYTLFLYSEGWEWRLRARAFILSIDPHHTKLSQVELGMAEILDDIYSISMAKTTQDLPPGP